VEEALPFARRKKSEGGIEKSLEERGKGEEEEDRNQR
jgi:hypothetical protein